MPQLPSASFDFLGFRSLLKPLLAKVASFLHPGQRHGALAKTEKTGPVSFHKLGARLRELSERALEADNLLKSNQEVFQDPCAHLMHVSIHVLVVFSLFPHSQRSQPLAGHLQRTCDLHGGFSTRWQLRRATGVDGCTGTWTEVNPDAMDGLYKVECGPKTVDQATGVESSETWVYDCASGT